MTQLTLDLFGDQARHQQWRELHQVGQIRLPYDTAGGDKAGDLIPAWRCCWCGAIELSQFELTLDHGCESRQGRDGCDPHCRRRHPDGGGPRHPYRMDEHWIPPDTTPEPAHQTHDRKG